jgi:hypothetical protein
MFGLLNKQHFKIFHCKNICSLYIGRKIEVEKKKLSDLLMEAPVMIVILKGLEFVFGITIPLCLEYLDKTKCI